MSIYQTIVVGTDGSPTSLRAVMRAADIAHGLNAKLVIACAYYAHARDVSPGHPESAPVVGEEMAQDRLNNAAAQVPQSVETHLVPFLGSPVAGLMAIVKDYDADLLVVGNRGMNSLTGRLLGSVPADIARQSDCDVIIVRTEDY